MLPGSDYVDPDFSANNVHSRGVASTFAQLWHFEPPGHGRAGVGNADYSQVPAVLDVARDIEKLAAKALV